MASGLLSTSICGLRGGCHDRCSSVMPSVRGRGLGVGALWGIVGMVIDVFENGNIITGPFFSFEFPFPPQRHDTTDSHPRS